MEPHSVALPPYGWHDNLIYSISFRYRKFGRWRFSSRARKHELANRAGVWIHPARTNTKDAEGNGGWPAQRHWYVHLLPAALANSGLRRRHFISAHLVHRYRELSTVWL